MASNITLYVQDNVSGSVQSNTNKIGIEPNSPDTDYILIVFTEKQNCNNTFTALFQNITTNCNVSEINILSADTNDYDNGQINWSKLGLYEVDIYYQSSDSNLVTDNATFSYTTCLEVSASNSCNSSAFSCDDLENCANFNSKLNAVTVDGTTITGDGTPANPLMATGSGSAAWGAITGTLSNQTDLQNALDSKTSEAPNDGNTYARESNTWAAILKIVDNVITTVSGTFGFGNGDYRLQLYSNQTQWGRVIGAINGYWESIFTGGRQKMIYHNSDEYTPEMNGDYSVNLNPTDTPNNLSTIKSFQPTILTISSNNDTLDSNNTANQFINYTGTGGVISIDPSYLSIGQEFCISQGGTDVVSLSGINGAVLQAPNNMLSTVDQFDSISGIKINSTTYRLTEGKA